MEEEASQSGPVRLRFTRLAKPIEYGYNDSNLPLPLAVVTSWVVFSCSTVSVGLSFINGNLHMYPVLVWEDNTSPNSVVLVLVIPTASRMFCNTQLTVPVHRSFPLGIHTAIFILPMKK